MDEILAVLDEYADHLGISRRPDDGGPLWDGKSLVQFTVDAVDSLAHDIAHWVLASPDRRRYVNFGWGEDYRWGPGMDDRLPEAWGIYMDPAYSSPFEETAACTLGFAYLLRVGYPNVDYLYQTYSLADRRQGRFEILDPDTIPARRFVQPHVEAFAAWLRHRNVPTLRRQRRAA